MLQPDYLRHEYIYAEHPTATGWNDVEIDQQILSYVHELIQQAHVVPPATLLELGCGMGNLTLPLARAGFQMVGIDISTTAIEVARERASFNECEGRFLVGDVTSAETYRSLEKVDCVLDGLCLHCIIGLDRHALLGFVREVLKPGGSFLVITMCGDPRGSRLSTRFDPASRYVIDGQIAERYLGQPHMLRKELQDAGFEVRYQRLVDGDTIAGNQDMLLIVARTL